MGNDFVAAKSWGVDSFTQLSNKSTSPGWLLASKSKHFTSYSITLGI